jgi:hypothetical protein
MRRSSPILVSTHVPNFLCNRCLGLHTGALEDHIRLRRAIHDRIKRKMDPSFNIFRKILEPKEKINHPLHGIVKQMHV